jgi:hypothetical protein
VDVEGRRFKSSRPIITTIHPSLATGPVRLCCYRPLLPADSQPSTSQRPAGRPDGRPGRRASTATALSNVDILEVIIILNVDILEVIS